MERCLCWRRRDGRGIGDEARAHEHLRSRGRCREDRAEQEEARKGLTGGEAPTLPASPTPAQALFARVARGRLLATTKCWPCKSNPVRLGSCVSRAVARREIAGFRPGFWPQGQLRHPSSFGERAWLRLLPEPQPLADLCDEVGHPVTLRRFASHFTGESRNSTRLANGRAEEEVVPDARRDSAKGSGESDGAAGSRLGCGQRVGSSC